MWAPDYFILSLHFKILSKTWGHWTRWSWGPLPCDIFQVGHGNLLLNYFQVTSLIAQLVKNPPAVQVSACKAGDLGLIPGSGRSPGEGNGNPLQYSCLRNPMDRGAWLAIDHGVARVGGNLATKPPPLSSCWSTFFWLLRLGPWLYYSHKSCNCRHLEEWNMRMLPSGAIAVLAPVFLWFAGWSQTPPPLAPVLPALAKTFKVF